VDGQAGRHVDGQGGWAGILARGKEDRLACGQADGQARRLVDGLAY
jgi:hypothetical protein